MKNKTTYKVSLVSILVINICLLISVLGTYALFSDSVTVSNHLQAGNLELKLERTNLVYSELNQEGYLEDYEVNTVVDFTSTNSSTANVFDLEDETLIVPGSEYEATMKISNNGSVAFGYWISINFTSQASDLADQVSIIVTTYDEQGNETEHVRSLSEGLTLGSDANPLGSVAVGSTSATFKVKIVFENVAENNDAQNDKASFDLVVNAIQLTEKK